MTTTQDILTLPITGLTDDASATLVEEALRAGRSEGKLKRQYQDRILEIIVPDKEFRFWYHAH